MVINRRELKSIIIDTLTKDKGARNNDLRLYSLVLKKVGYPTDLKELSKMTGSNILETIRRTRQKAQETNPLLQAEGKVKRKRNAHKKVYEEIAREL